MKTGETTDLEQTKRTFPPRDAVCPTCGEWAHFTFLGEQRWPPRVAAALGLSEVMLQWTCSKCHTTISEVE